MITKEKIDTEIELNNEFDETNDKVRCTIITDQHLLSGRLLDSLERIHIVPIMELPTHNIAKSHLIIIHDLATSESERKLITDILAPLDEKFIVRVTDRPVNECKAERAFIDSNFSVYGLDNQIDLCRDFTNTLIESLELSGMICMDYADVYCQFCNTGICKYLQGKSTSVSKRTLQALENTVPEPITYSAVGAVVIIYAGLTFQLEEFEEIGNYMNKILPDSCSITIGHRLPIDDPYTDSLKIAVFINQRFD